MLKMLLDTGINPNTCGFRRQPPLFDLYCMGSCDEFNPFVIKLLVDCGANANIINDKGLTPLQKCIHFPKPLTVNALIECGADIARKNDVGDPPIVNALKHDDAFIARDLLQDFSYIQILFSVPHFSYNSFLITLRNNCDKLFEEEANPLEVAFLLQDQILIQNICQLSTSEKQQFWLQQLREWYPGSNMTLLEETIQSA